MAQALQLRQRPGTTGCERWLGPCRQAPGGADEVCQAGLACLHPALVHAITITDQEPFPVVDQGREGFFVPMRMNHVERHRFTVHHPQPLQRVGEEPRGFINVVDWSPAGVQRNSVIVRGDRLVTRSRTFWIAPKLRGTRSTEAQNVWTFRRPLP